MVLLEFNPLHIQISLQVEDVRKYYKNINILGIITMKRTAECSTKIKYKVKGDQGAGV